MKRLLTLLMLALTLVTGSFAQKSYINYNKDSRWFIGINGGATWHSRTEVDNLILGGYGFTFGRSFGMRPEKLFSWDLRFRYLHGWWGGQSSSQYQLDSTSTLTGYPSTTLQTYQDSLGYFIPNFRTQLLSGSLELALNTNRLRENTGWNIQIFGGIGIKGYNSRADLTNSSGQIYDYTQVNQTKLDLISAQDGNYETLVNGGDGDFEIDWMGSFGLGISYQLTPWASVGISHKMTWTRRNDKFDLMPNDVGGIPTANNDIYHYSSAGLKFHLFGGNHRTNDRDPIVENSLDVNKFDPMEDPVVTNPPVRKPIVDIYDPGASPYTTRNDEFVIRAHVHYVPGRQNISFKQNGNTNNNFSYNATNDMFQSPVILQAGQNIFEINAWNDSGQDYESMIIIYKPEEPLIEPPIVTITSPPYSPYGTNNSTFNFAATVLNVDSKSQIKMYFNGAYMPNFSYNTGSKALYGTLNLLEGTNTVTVTGTTLLGSDSKTVRIIYDKPEVIQPPVVNFFVPAIDPITTNQQIYDVTASVLNVDDKNNILVEVNGHPTSNFSFNSVTKNVSFSVSLLEGANIIKVSGSNVAGVDYDNTTIIYKKQEAPKAPIVTFINPALDPIIVYSASYSVRAKVENVNSASNISLKINGVKSDNFTYSESSKLMVFTSNLLMGSNVIEITGTNGVGSDQETTTIIYRRVFPQAPPIVTITYPGIDNQEFNTPDVTLSASVLNVSGAANITAVVNGNQTAEFNYNTATKILTLPLNMIEGPNSVKITGTNARGTDFDSRIVIYKKPAVPSPPTVAFVNPPSSPYLVSSENYQITANTTNIDSKSQISLIQNGNLIADNQYAFTYSHQVIYNAQLIPGSNVFEIIVANNDGLEDEMAIVTYTIDNDPCIIPTVGYISPVPYSTVTDPNVIIDAQINNHTPEAVVEMKLNGISQGFMIYNQNTSIASIPAMLDQGSNGITVMVTNNCGSNQATFTLNYKAPEAPCIDPTVVANGSTTLTTHDSTISLQAGLTEVANVNDIMVTLNGQATAFVYDQGTNTVSINNASLTLGNNAIIVTATNDCGTASTTFHVKREPCALPLISNPSHNNGFITPDLSLSFNATVANVTQHEVVMVINNISQAFTFDEQTGLLSSGISLIKGQNTVVITATSTCGTTTETYSFIRETPCEPIKYNLLSPSTLTTEVTDASYDILLHADGTLSANGISATLNGTQITVAFDDVAGNILISGITLVEGTNTVTLNLSNDCSRETIILTIIYTGCEPPVIDITGLADNTVLSTNSLDFQAVVQNSNGSGNIALSVNGNAQSFNFDGQTNLLTSTITLVEGANTIAITVEGCEIKSKIITVKYEIPCVPISYTLMQPGTNDHLVTSEQYELTLNLVGIDNPQQITVTHNDNVHPFNYVLGTQILSVDGLVLANGENAIVVMATNDCSSETIVYEIEYNGCQPPVITLGSNSNVSGTPLFDFTANITNVVDQNSIQVLLNGAPVSFVYDATYGIINAEVTLAEGQNAIQILAATCGNDEKEFNVTYIIPCEPVVYSLATPSQLETSVSGDTYSIDLVLQHADPNTISVTLNGIPIPHSYSNDLMTIANIALIDGDNLVAVTMSNTCSNETVTYTIHHDGCDAPVINTTGSSDAVTDAVYNLSAHVTNTTNQGEIGLTLNGATANFTYDPGTGELNAQLLLNEGVNIIVISANGCALATETFNVTYSIPCVPVSHSLTSPSQPTAIVLGAITSLSLNVQQVENSDGISATLNGNPTPFAFSNNVITLDNVTLVEGSNIVVVTFGNDCSSEIITYTIESDQCDSPNITVTNNNVVTNTSLYTFACNVQNIADGNNLQLSLNGQTIPSNFANGVLTAQISLQEGPNSVTITANGCETTSVTYTITYQVPCNPITFMHVTPTTNDTLYQENTDLMVKINAQNVEQSGINVTLNGNTVNFDYLNGNINIQSQGLVIGNNSLVIHMSNTCNEAEAIFHVVVGEPCRAPAISFNKLSAEVDNASFAFAASVTNIENATALVVELNGQTVPFNFTNGNITANLTLNQGVNIIKVEAAGCVSVVATCTVTFTSPCYPVTFALISPSSQTEVATTDSYSIELSTGHVTNPASVVATVNDKPFSSVFNGQNGHVLLNNIPLNDGQNVIKVSFSNECSRKIVEYAISYTAPPAPCGPRFNPGNSDWEFCLVTPTGTYSRDDLANNASFTYTGPATQAYFKPIAGGGNAVINGQDYVVQSGQYYLFDGNLSVDVGSTHPGSMGHWEICLSSDANPAHGTGANKPASPCDGITGPTNPDFNVEGNGTVHVESNFCTTIKCLGESVIYNNSQEAYVTMEYSIDGGANYYQFNNNNYVNGDEQLMVQTPSGSDIVLKATCVNQNGNWSNVEISNTGSQYVYVLKDGDQAPNFVPAQGQASIETFLSGFIDSQGTVSIGPNDVIYLFELRFVGNYGIDYQDCVMLITLQSGSNCQAPSNPTTDRSNHGQVYLAPKFTQIAPKELKSSSYISAFSLKTKVDNVNDPADLKVLLNGGVVSSFNYNMDTKLLTSNLKLREGTNTIRIKATNGNKQSQVTYSVEYKPKSQTTTSAAAKPLIININPRTITANSGARSYTFKSKVLNVLGKANIKLYLNGADVTNFFYSSASQQVSAIIRLREGSNTVKLVAINRSEKAERRYTVIYRPAHSDLNTNQGAVQPTIRNINPKTMSAQSSTLTYSFKAKVGNVASKANIKLFLNDQTLKAFSYTSSTQQVSAVLRLRSGANRIKIEASNGGKKAERIYTVTYKAESSSVNMNETSNPKPTISDINPRGAKVTVSTVTFMYKAKVQNVSAKSNIHMTLNGSTFNNFSYNSASRQVMAMFKLRKGTNTITIKGIDGKESAQKSYTIIYAPRTTTGGGSRTITPIGGKTTIGGGTKTTTGGGSRRTTGGGTKTTTSGGS